MRFNLPIFPFIVHASGVKCKNSLPGPRFRRFSAMFSSKSFIVLCFMCKSMIYFELICVEGVRRIGQKVHFFAHWCTAAPTPLIENLFPARNCFCAFVKNQLCTLVWVYFWVLYSVPAIYVFILPPVPQCLDYCSYIIRLIPPILFFFFKTDLAILAPLPFHINSIIILLGF